MYNKLINVIVAYILLVNKLIKRLESGDTLPYHLGRCAWEWRRWAGVEGVATAHRSDPEGHGGGGTQVGGGRKKDREKQC